eukprot:Em0138g1a
MNLYKAARPPKPLTAGIIPYNIQSQHGNMVLYDMAGQPEYYTSHCACIEAISFSSPAIFLTLVDADQTNVLSAETSTILPLLTTLSAKGLILFILNKRNPDESWIVVQKNMLLERVAELTVLHDIRKTFSQFCSSIDVEELVIDPRQVYTLFNKGVMPTSLPRVEISKLKNAILSKSDAVRDDNGKVVAIAEWIRAENRLPKLIELNMPLLVYIKSSTVPSSSSSLPSDLVDQTDSHLKEDFFDVYRAVLDVVAVWSDLGLALRMRKPELDVIRESHPQSPKDCLKAILSGWLQGRNGPPTWGALCEAVAEPAGGNNRALAEEIARNHGVTLKP